MARQIYTTSGGGCCLPLFTLMIVVPFVELALLLKLAEVTTVSFTIGLVVVTGIVGSLIARREGASAYMRFQGEVNQGKLPAQAALDGLFILIGAIVLMTPGVLTDVFGFICLLPPTRKLLQNRMKAWLEKHIEAGTIQTSGVNFMYSSQMFGGQQQRPQERPSDPTTIDVEAHDIEPDAIDVTPPDDDERR